MGSTQISSKYFCRCWKFLWWNASLCLIKNITKQKNSETLKKKTLKSLKKRAKVSLAWENVLIWNQTSIIHNEKMLGTFLLRSGIRQKSLLPLLFKNFLLPLSKKIRKKKYNTYKHWRRLTNISGWHDFVPGNFKRIKWK